MHSDVQIVSQHGRNFHLPATNDPQLPDLDLHSSAHRNLKIKQNPAHSFMLSIWLMFKFKSPWWPRRYLDQIPHALGHEEQILSQYNNDITLHSL